MDADTLVKHKFQEDSNMTFREVSDFAYERLVPILRGLAAEFGEDRFFDWTWGVRSLFLTFCRGPRPPSAPSSSSTVPSSP